MAYESILIVDDHPANVKLLSVLLRTRGYQLRTAFDAGEALTVLSDFHPQLILLDLQMPGIDGLALTRWLRENPKYRDVIIVAVTAYAMNGDAARARAAGCDGYITKPIDTRTFLGTVASYLAREPQQHMTGS